MPFIHVLNGVIPLAFDVANDMSDSTLVYIIPRDCNNNWPPGISITIFADEGLPDAFGRPLAIPVTGRSHDRSNRRLRGRRGRRRDRWRPERRRSRRRRAG